MLVSKAVVNEDFSAFSEAVQEQKYSFRTISEIKKEIISLDQQTTLRWGKSLIEGNTIQATIGGVMISKSNIWESDPDFLIKRINRFATSDSWQKREIAIELLKQALIYSKKEYIPLLKELTSSSNMYKRRVAITASKQIALLKPKYNSLKLDVLAILTPFLFENDRFVTISVIDTFANGFIKYCPSEVLLWLEKLIPSIKKNNHKVLFLRLIATKIPSEHLFDVIRILIKFIDNKDISVAYARHAVFRTLAKEYPNKIAGWLDHNLHLEAVVDHWAELELEGLIPSVC